MAIKNLRNLNKFDVILCLIFSIIIFFLFNNISFFKNLLGEVNLTDGMGFTNNGVVTKPISCNDYFFCRAPTIPYLYYYLLNTITVDFVIFLQIFLLVLATFLIRVELINLNLSLWIINFLFIIIIINPKILKYSLGTQEESFYIPALLFVISSLIKFILKKNIKNLIYLNLSFALMVLIREAGIILYFLPIILNVYYLIKLDDSSYKKKLSFITIFFLILISPQVINKSLTNHLNHDQIKNHYFSMHALASFISKQEKYIDIYFNNFILFSFTLILISSIQNYYTNYYSQHFSEKIKISFITSFIAIFLQLILHLYYELFLDFVLVIFWIAMPVLFLLVNFMM